MKRYIIDTHALHWYLTGDHRLSKRAENALEDPEAALVIPTVVLAEISHLHCKGKITVTPAKVLDVLGQDQRMRILPFDLECVENFPDLDLHDAMIVSLALVMQKRSPDDVVKIITKDEVITEKYPMLTLW